MFNVAKRTLRMLWIAPVLISHGAGPLVAAPATEFLTLDRRDSRSYRQAASDHTVAAHAAPNLTSPCKADPRYKAHLDVILTSNNATLTKQARSVIDRNCGGCVAFQYILDGVMAMGEATRDPVYIARALGWAETIISTATITDSGGYRNWPGGWVSPYSSTPISYQLDDLLLGPALARVARVILLDSALKATYGTRAQAVYSFVDRNIAEKWLVARDGERWLLDLARNVGAHPRMSDRVPQLGLMLMDLVAVSPNTRYSNALSDIVTAHASRLKPVGNAGALWLDVGAPCRDGDSCDTAHAGLYVDFMVRAHEDGLGVTLGQLQGVAKLLSTIIWNGSTHHPMFTNYTDGSNETFRGRGAWGNGSICTGWQSLANVDATVETIVSAVLHALNAGRNNPSLDAMNTIHGQVELIGHLSRAQCRARARSSSPPPGRDESAMVASPWKHPWPVYPPSSRGTSPIVPEIWQWRHGALPPSNLGVRSMSALG